MEPHQQTLQEELGNQQYNPPENLKQPQEDLDKNEKNLLPVSDDQDQLQHQNRVPVFRLSLNDEDEDEDEEEDQQENPLLASPGEYDEEEEGDQRENLVPVSSDQWENHLHNLEESDEQSYNLLAIIFQPDGSTILNLDGQYYNFDTLPYIEELWSLLYESEDFDGYRDDFLAAREIAILDNLKTRKYELLDNQEPEICVVCQSEYEKEEILGCLDCGHEYHADCIKRWLLLRNTCPICRRTAIHQEC